ncbi:tRNA pseudouridine(38-40) synthase TruA [Flavobacterium sp. NST-5]|uniref:tRNA pseudouridine synthase A n=1 Tax=Flavobacterium ichthyis TaxID=2698827 RepID=A0ABW9Z6B1_9FLAO|nr:tRNA pseudouridine(38-40) synthase TruA [Flavobacterium ichthyis]NBL64231.1 tRNA pseudouridine(38-40) synthase TruA [Flavobacterium ichthyis]
MRYFIEFSYNGKNYHGWQSQPNASSVQETLTKALITLLCSDLEIVGAGRTDSGVHASQMFAHFDFEENFDQKNLIQKLNSYLPKDIAVTNIHQVPNDAHARFDATKRTYEYHIDTQKNVFNNEQSWFCHLAPDLKLMNEAAKILFDYTDFECFSKTHSDVRTFNCKIMEAYWVQHGSKLIFTIAADRFLRNMVRAIVGTMVEIGTEKKSIENLRTIIESKNRGNAGASAPAHGLYLTRVEYPYISNK